MEFSKEGRGIHLKGVWGEDTNAGLGMRGAWSELNEGFPKVCVWTGASLTKVSIEIDIREIRAV